ncbi:MAG: NAD-dependent deacylase [Cytophagales bacterium]|nr:NAD-dependent deacylase [Cytophagales bacterium]MDW8384712.1 NAD-dependent deacylase [Flammeovirgaceae bacterium]
MNQRQKIVVLSGAGVSAESGVATFRDHNGLWENHRIEDVATPEAWRKNPALVLEFYNKRRKQLLEVQPNEAHLLIAELEKYYDVYIITQNVDDLHERAGSTKVLHLHGELKKVRSTLDENLVYHINEIDPKGWELKLGDRCAKGSQLRPHIVWFGELVPMMEEAIRITQTANIMIIIGTSLLVYPAAGLSYYLPKNASIYVIDPQKPDFLFTSPFVKFITQKATTGMKELFKELTKDFIN